MKRLFEDPDRITKLPRPIALAVQEMLVEIDVSGEHTTADETVNLIEEVFSHLGRVWVAEYLKQGAFDENFNRNLFETLGRNVSIGQWISMSRIIRSLFQESGHATLMSGLEVQDYGEQGDEEHPVAQLISYRNSFSHGSMKAVVDDIRAHRHLIEEILMNLPCLIDQPLQVVVDKNGTCLEANGLWEHVKKSPSSAIPLQPYVQSKDKEDILEFYPLLYVAQTDEGFELQHTTAKNTQHPVSKLFEREALRVWYERYERERQGHLDFNEDLGKKTSIEITKQVSEQLREAIADRSINLILIRAYPGCGKTAAIAGLIDSKLKLLPKDRFAEVALYEVKMNHLSQSGMTFANFLLRRIEKALELDEGHYKLKEDAVRETLDEAFDALSGASREILLGIEDLHLGQSSYRGEPASVLDLYRMLPGKPVTVISTVLYGAVAGPLFFDEAIEWPVAEADSVEQADLETVIKHLFDSSFTLRKDVLSVLSKQNEAVDCFAVCDALEGKGQQNVFEPAVERALWDLKPLLIEEREKENRIRKWQLYSPKVSETLKGMEA